MSFCTSLPIAVYCGRSDGLQRRFTMKKCYIGGDTTLQESNERFKKYCKRKLGEKEFGKIKSWVLCSIELYPMFQDTIVLDEEEKRQDLVVYRDWEEIKDADLKDLWHKEQCGMITKSR